MNWNHVSSGPSVRIRNRIRLREGPLSSRASTRPPAPPTPPGPRRSQCRRSGGTGSQADDSEQFPGPHGSGIVMLALKLHGANLSIITIKEKYWAYCPWPWGRSAQERRSYSC